jgi:hypothetical protein
MREALERWAEHVATLPAQKLKAIRLRAGADRTGLADGSKDRNQAAI